MNTKIGHIEVELVGDKALFATPESKQNGMPVSYQVPTFGGIRGLLGDIYRHKTPFDFNWCVSKIRVMNPIKFDTITYSFVENDLKTPIICPHTYLSNVRYQVCADILFKDGKEYNSDKEHENAAVKAEHMFKRNTIIPYKNICFGRAECEAFAKIRNFGEGDGFYDNIPEYHLGNMFIQFDYLDDNPFGKKRAYFANIVMKNGIIELPKKEDCFSIDFK